MTRPDLEIETDRLILRPWRAEDLDDFVRLHANAEAMRDHGVTLSAERCRKKLDDYRTQYDRHGFIRWNVSEKTGAFLGYVGLYPNGANHPLGTHGDIGWRLLPKAWGKGFATEAARAALDHALNQCNQPEVLAYTQKENLASQAVIARLPLHRDASRDFSIDDDVAGLWHGMVWTTRIPT